MQAACWTCRRRTIQCDRTSVPCAKCQKAGLQCFEKRPLRWVTGVAIRGRMRGRGYEGKDFHSDKESLAVLDAYTVFPATKSSPLCSLQDPWVHGLDSSSKFLLNYYNVRIAQLYIVYDSGRNPFRRLSTWAVNSSLVQKCILALAARHFANNGHSFESFDQANDALSPRSVKANLDALRLKQQSIKALATSISNPESLPTEEFLAAILLLIFLDILESGIDGWKHHLRGAESLFNLSHSLLGSGSTGDTQRGSTGTEEETRQFIARQLSLISIIGGSLSDSKLRPEFVAKFPQSKHQESIFRSFLGCPEFLLGAIRYFSNQRHVIEDLHMHDSSSIQESIQDTLTMLELTIDFDGLEWASDTLQSGDTTAKDIHKLSSLAQAYKNATILYGIRVLRAFRATAITEVSDSKNLVVQLLDLIGFLKCDKALLKCLLWPTFVAGLDCQTPGQEQLVMEYLKNIWDLTSCLNVINASKILRDYWKQKNGDGSSVTKETDLHIIQQGWLLI